MVLRCSETAPVRLARVRQCWEGRRGVQSLTIARAISVWSAYGAHDARWPAPDGIAPSHRAAEESPGPSAGRAGVPAPALQIALRRAAPLPIWNRLSWVQLTASSGGTLCPRSPGHRDAAAARHHRLRPRNDDAINLLVAASSVLS